MYYCEKHNLPGSETCQDCEREDRKALLAHRLALFLGTNEVETWTSPSGYKLQKITRRKLLAPTGTPWCQSSKEEAA